MYQNYDKGGIRVPNADVMAKSLRLAWISRLLSNDEEWSQVWKAIPNHFFDMYGGLNFLLRCNYDSSFLKQTGMPQFYQVMLQCFHVLKSSYETDLGQDLVLFNNKEILIDRKTFFYKSWFQKGIFRVHDLLTNNGAFLSHGEFTTKYNLKCNFLQYLQVVSAIPRRLVEKAKLNLDPKFTYLPDDTFFQLSSSININLLKWKSRDYYWLFIHKDNPELKAPKKWARDLQSNEIELTGYFKHLRNICKENNLREFYFKFSHRIIVSRKELCLYGIESDSACVYCQEPDSIGDSFIHCRWLKEFFTEVIKWFNEENGTSYSPNIIEILFGKFPTVITAPSTMMLKKFNYALLFARYYLYNNKLNSKELRLKEFIKKLELKYRIEKL